MEKKQTITPVLRILDIPKAREFYIDWLGFTIDWEHRFGENFPSYFQISKDGIIIHLTEHYGDCLPGARIRVRLDGLPAFYSSLKEYRYLKPGLEKTEWGTRELNLIDPFGNHIVFTEDLDQSNPDA